jgi:hypothetical protein
VHREHACEYLVCIRTYVLLCCGRNATRGRVIWGRVRAARQTAEPWGAGRPGPPPDPPISRRPKAPAAPREPPRRSAKQACRQAARCRSRPAGGVGGYLPLEEPGGRGPAEPPRSSRLKIVCGNLGTEPGGGTLLGLAGGGGLCGRGADMFKSLARQRWPVRSSPAKATQAPAQGTGPDV